MSAPMVSLAAVSKSFGQTRALADVTFDVRRGELFGLIGPDGAGKTTTLRAMTGLIGVDAGSVTVGGVDPRRDRRAMSATIGYVAQRFSLYGDLSIDENLAFAARIHGVRDFAARRNRLLDLTRLTPFRDRLADQLSGGMKQKLALACTLIHEPPLLVLDEPTTGVDPVSRREFWKLLAEFLASGLTIIMATPYLDEAERCSRVVLLADGRVLADDEPRRLQAAFGGSLHEVVASPPRKALAHLRQAFGVDAQLFGDRLHVRGQGATASSDADRWRSSLEQAGIGVEDIRAVPPTLEDVFIAKLADLRKAAAAALVSVVLLALPSGVLAQAGQGPAPQVMLAPMPLTLADALERGLAQSPRLAEARAREAAAAATVRAREADGRPSVTALGAYLRTNHVEEFGVRQLDGSFRTIFPDIPSNYRLRAEALVPLYTSGRVDAMVRAAEADGRAASADKDSLSADVRLGVTQAYWGLVLARRRVGVLERAEARADVLIDDARARVNAGVAPPNEVLSAEAQKARQTVRVIQARHEAAIAEVTLARLLGLPADQPIDPTTPVDGPAAGAEVPAGRLAGSEATAVVQSAIDRRADRRSLLDRAAFFRASADAATSALRPRVFALAAVEPGRPNNRFVPRSDEWQTSWDLGVTLSWSLWDGGRARAEAASARAQAEAVAHRVREFDAALSIEVRARQLEVETARAALRASATAVTAAAEARRVLNERFRSGVATSTDVLDADLVLLETELEQTTWAVNLRLAEARWRRAIGDQP